MEPVTCGLQHSVWSGIGLCFLDFSVFLNFLSIALLVSFLILKKVCLYLFAKCYNVNYKTRLNLKQKYNQTDKRHIGTSDRFVAYSSAQYHTSPKTEFHAPAIVEPATLAYEMSHTHLDRQLGSANVVCAWKCLSKCEKNYDLMFWRTCVPLPLTAADIDCCKEHVCAVHTVYINANFFPDSIMCLSTNVIQGTESFFMLPAVNWRYTFNTAWRQHKSIIYILSATRCSSLSIDGYTDISTRYCGHWGTRASRIKESVPLLPNRFVSIKNLTTEYSELHCPWLTVCLPCLRTMYRDSLHYTYIHVKCSLTPWNRLKGSISHLFILKSPSFTSRPLKEPKIADHP